MKQIDTKGLMFGRILNDFSPVRPLQRFDAGIWFDLKIFKYNSGYDKNIRLSVRSIVEYKAQKFGAQYECSNPRCSGKSRFIINSNWPFIIKGKKDNKTTFTDANIMMRKSDSIFSLFNEIDLKTKRPITGAKTMNICLKQSKTENNIHPNNNWSYMVQRLE